MKSLHLARRYGMFGESNLGQATAALHISALVFRRSTSRKAPRHTSAGMFSGGGGKGYSEEATLGDGWMAGTVRLRYPLESLLCWICLCI